MKTAALFGFISALAGAFLTMAMFFLGLHSDAAKLPVANWIGGIGGLVIYMVCITMGMKARRAEWPASDEFGYGRALWTGLQVALISTLLTILFNYVYNAFINPAFHDIMLQDRLAKLESSGMSGDKLEQAESITRVMAGPMPMAVSFLVVGLIFGLVISLIVAGIVKRPAAQPPRV